MLGATNVQNGRAELAEQVSQIFICLSLFTYSMNDFSSHVAERNRPLENPAGYNH
jgi:hypothetical protein